jgi:DNA polymerase (family 10)
MKNSEIADIFYEIANLLEIKGIEFKPAAYRRAAQNITQLQEEITEIHKKGALKEISGVGESIAAKIKEILETGKLQYLEDLRKEFPTGVLELVKIGGIGPKIALKLSKDYGIKSVEELENAAKEGRIRKIKGFGPKKEENILRSIEVFKAAKGTFLLGEILPLAKTLESKIKELSVVSKINVAGSIRRKKETVRDIYIIVTSKEPDKIINFFTKLPIVNEILAEGETKCSVVLNNKIQVDLRIVDEDSYGSALQYFTGSKEHNIELRELAKKRNWKLNEYGLYDNTNNSKIAGKEEAEIYKALGMDFIEPELRENSGEIESALKGTLPNLINFNDVKGDLHMHTTWSDGSNSIEEMALASKKLGYEYIAICDHSAALKVAGGLSEEDILKQIKEIKKINRKFEDFTVLSGIELNIDSKGYLDVNNTILKDLDFVIASVHSGFKQDEQVLTNRVLSAMSNDYVNAIGHPTGRLINRRPSYKIDIHKVFETASELGIFLEINAFIDRLDLSDINCKMAKEYNSTFVIGTDAHNINELKFMEYGVFVAKRGWLEKENVVNALSLKDLRIKLKS